MLVGNKNKGFSDGERERQRGGRQRWERDEMRWEEMRDRRKNGIIKSEMIILGEWAKRSCREQMEELDFERLLIFNGHKFRVRWLAQLGDFFFS